MAKKLISYSSEMITNFKQAEVMSPEDKFEALQTDSGYSLLFSIGTDDVFYVTQETPGHATGWEKTDLSSALKADYGGASITAKTFAVAHNRATLKIDMAVVVNASGNDNLYLSLGNSSSDMSWVSQPNWLRIPFDDAAHPLSKVSVVNVFISGASDGEYIVVDVLRDPNDTMPLIFRYYIEPTKKPTGQAWNPHDVAVDLDASKVSSCLGRRAKDRVDGLYTLGTIGGHIQLIYQPLYNALDPKRIVPPNPARLILPDNSAPSAIASVAVSGNLTDLYVACEGALYYFPNDGQKDGAQGIKVLDNALFEEASRLFAFATDTKVIVWGLNRAQQIFYTTCDRTQIQNSAAWSHPLPILENVEQLSPYVNRADDGNTFFAHTGVGQLQKAVQTPATMTWKFDSILLPPLDKKAKAANFSSYTTRLHVTDETKTALPNVDVSLGALHRVSVYINNRYYVLEPTPITVKTDGSGGVVIVERILNLQGTGLQVHADDGSIISINPMEKPFQKVAALDSPDKLSAATVKNPDGSAKPLIDSTTDKNDKQNVVDTITSLNTAYQTLPSDGSVKPPAGPRTLARVPASHVMTFASPNAVMALSIGDGFADFGHMIESAAGDLFNYMKSGVDYVIHIVKDAAEDVWHFVAEIAGKMYHFVLDAAVKVLGALEYIFNAIKTFIVDLIKFLLFLLEWRDFVRTKDVFKKLLVLYFDYLLDGLDTVKTDLNGVITSARNSVDDWAGVKRDDWHSGIENKESPLSFIQTLTDFEKVFTAPAMFFFQHFVDNVSNSEGTDDGGKVEQMLDRIIQALEDEGNVLVDAANRIKSELIDGSAFASLSLSDVLKKLTAIVVDALLNSAEDVLDLMIDVFVMLAREVIAALDTPIWIPVISDILEFFGVKINFSMLDVICMVGAIPATLVYKLIFDHAPFSSGDGFTDQVADASNIYALKAALGGGGTPKARALMAPAFAMDAAPGKQESPVLHLIGIELSPETQNVVFLMGHLVGGIVAFLTAVLAIADVTSSSSNNEFNKAVGISGAVGAMAGGLAVIVAQPNAIQNTSISRLSTACTGLTLLGKVAFKVKTLGDAEKTKKVEKGFDALIAVLALVPTCYHFYELSKEPASKGRTEAFIDESSNVSNLLNRITAFAVVMDKDPESKAVLATIMGVLIMLYGGLQIGESIAEAV
jgi:hypothetical protein